VPCVEKQANRGRTSGALPLIRRWMPSLSENRQELRRRMSAKPENTRAVPCVETYETHWWGATYQTTSQ
jgi:hypothetical protein